MPFTLSKYSQPAARLVLPRDGSATDWPFKSFTLLMSLFAGTTSCQTFG